jgi:hypothetical protein
MSARTTSSGFRTTSRECNAAGYMLRATTRADKNRCAQQVTLAKGVSFAKQFCGYIDDDIFRNVIANVPLVSVELGAELASAPKFIAAFEASVR